MRVKVRPTLAIIALTVFTVAAIAVSVAALLWHARVETISLTRMLAEQNRQNFDNVNLVLQGLRERLQNEYGRQLSLDSRTLTRRASSKSRRRMPTGRLAMSSRSRWVVAIRTIRTIPLMACKKAIAGALT